MVKRVNELLNILNTFNKYNHIWKSNSQKNHWDILESIFERRKMVNECKTSNTNKVCERSIASLIRVQNHFKIHKTCVDIYAAFTKYLLLFLT